MLNRRLTHRLARASAVVLEMAVTVVLGVFAGDALDQYFATSPLFLISLSIAALIVGMWRLTTTLNRLLGTNDRLPPDPDH